MRIKVTDFAGVAPRIHPQDLPNNMATQAVNTKLWGQGLQGYYAPQRVTLPNTGAPVELDAASTGVIRSLFRAVVEPEQDDHDGLFFHTVDIAEYARAALPGDGNWTVLITGGGVSVPRITDRTQQAGPRYPTAWHALGISVPVTNGTSAAVSGVPLDEAASPVTDGVNRSYLFAFVNSRGQLGPTSLPVSPPSVWLQGQSVVLDGIPIPAASDLITSVRIFRTVTAGTSFRFVAEIPVGQLQYTDLIPEEGLGETAVSATYEAPPEDMRCIGVMSNGIAYGASKNDVCLSQPFLNHAWNPLARETLTFDIVAMGHFGTTIVAVTGENPYMVYGNTPGRMQQRKYNINQGCLSKRGLVSGIFGVTYPCKDGLVLVSSGGATVISSSHFTRDEWLYMSPRTLNAELYADRFIGFIDRGEITEALPAEKSITRALAQLPNQMGFIVDPNDPQSGMVMITEFGTAMYSDPTARALYYVKNNELWQWDADRSRTMEYIWQSKEFVSAHGVTFSCGRVLADTYTNITVEFYADDILQHTQIVGDRDIFWFPGGSIRKARTFYFRVVATDTITEINFATSPKELAT